jgi:Holliday junction resolvasome RuvABC endonuclease subunit
MKLLAIDPSLTATGLVVVELGPDTERVLEQAFVQTKPDAKSRHVYQADQDGARIDEIADAVLRLMREHRVDIVACEAPAGSQHANAAKALALAYGAIRGALRAVGMTPIMVQAHHAKKAAAGSQGATKDEVLAAMQRRFSVEITGSKPRKEAIADALANACAAMGEPTVQALRRQAASAPPVVATTDPDEAPIASSGSLFG